jgi:UPF0271 protein
LDSSAFYAGLPFRSLDKFVTTFEVFDEIRHIKKDHNALDVLFETNRLKIMQAENDTTKQVILKSKETGDYQQLSKQDISVLALCVENNGELVTDDFAVSNVAKNMGIDVVPLMTNGITDVGKWIHYCAGCGKNYEDGISECPICGNHLKKKLIKNKT